MGVEFVLGPIENHSHDGGIVGFVLNRLGEFPELIPLNQMVEMRSHPEGLSFVSQKSSQLGFGLDNQWRVLQILQSPLLYESLATNIEDGFIDAEVDFPNHVVLANDQLGDFIQSE